MKKLTFAVGALAASLVTPAMAADLAVKAPPPVYRYSWTGCYIGGNVGGLWAHKDWTVAPGDPTLGAVVGAPFGSHDPNSWLGGAQAGCDYQFAGGFVVGIAGDYDWTNAKASSGDAVNNLAFATTGYLDQSNIKNLASVTGRVGYGWDRFLGYVKGGGAWERDDYTIFTPAGLAAATASQTRGGWTVGVGGEYAFTNWLTGFAEYDYYNFGTRDLAFVSSGAVIAAGRIFDVVSIKETKSVFKAGLNLRWGPGPVVAKY
jgi:outer membrane immunogenic protein